MNPWLQAANAANWAKGQSPGVIRPLRIMQDQARLVLEAEEDCWRYRAEQHFALSHDRLTITLSLKNSGTEVMPFSFGLHPWFPRHGNARLRFAAQGFWQLTAEGETIALGAVPEDLDFTQARPLPRRGLNERYEGWPGQAEIDWPELGLGLVIESDPIFSRLMLYSHDYDPETFCIEPQTCAPCGFDSLETDPSALGAHILVPGKESAAPSRCDC